MLRVKKVILERIPVYILEYEAAYALVLISEISCW